VERFYKERIETQDGSSLTATSLYEDYCAWCEEQQKEPLALPTFGREFGELGVQKARIAGRVRYIGIALKSAGLEEDKKLPALGTVAA
jgi:phage/plasmid-associated DNA primase